MACPYANLLGVPKQGVHAERIFGFAQNDFLATFIVAAITAYLFNWSFLYSFIIWFVGGEVLHYAFGVQSEFLTRLGIRVPC
jgi:hypothetical protein